MRYNRVIFQMISNVIAQYWVVSCFTTCSNVLLENRDAFQHMLVSMKLYRDP